MRGLFVFRGSTEAVGIVSKNNVRVPLLLYTNKKNTFLGAAENMRTTSTVGIKMHKMLLILVFTLAIALRIEGSLPPLDEEDNVLHIGAIFPIQGEGGWQGGQVSFHVQYHSSYFSDQCFSSI